MTKVLSMLLGLFFLTGSLWADEIGELHNLGYVVISLKGPTDGGDFGPQTPGTQTSGFQEAINFSVTNNKDIFVIGGGIQKWVRLKDGGFNEGGLIEGGYTVTDGPVWYYLDKTLYIPAAENFRLVGGSYSLGSRCTDGDALVIDSQKNFEFACDLVLHSSLPEGRAMVRIKPQTPRPDGVIGFSNSFFNAIGVVGGGTVMGGQDGKTKDGTGIGLLLDASVGPIAFNTFHITEINACHKGLVLEKGDVHSNVFELIFNHATNYPIVVKTGSYNRIKSLVDVAGTGIAASPIGLQILGGHQNIFDMVIHSGFGSGRTNRPKGIVFGQDARDNLVYVKGLSHDGATGLPIIDGITNNARNSTNRIIPFRPVGFNILTPALPASGKILENRLSYTILATIGSPGDVSDWTLTDGNGITQTVHAGLYAGQLICLEPGDKLSFDYRITPRWTWQALR